VQQCVDMDGATREEGDSWTEDCNSCMCTKSGKSCTKRLCNFSVPFLSSSTRAEEVSGCLDSEGTRREEGDSWEEDCNRCRCTNSGSSCTKRLCNFAAPLESVRTEEGFQCLDREGTSREIGDSWTEDCNNCMCTKSGSSCTKKLCNFLGHNLGLPCTDEKNIVRQHSESWMKESSPPEVLKEIADVQLVWLTDLSMEIQLDENTTDVIILAPSSNIPGEETPCLFSGKVGKDQDSLVTVSGCRDDEEVTVSIASRRVPGGFVDLTISEGKTFEVRVVGSFFERPTCTCTDGEISCAVQVPRADPPPPPQLPSAPLLGSSPGLPLPASAPLLPDAPQLPSVPKVHFPRDEVQQRKVDFKSTSGSTYSLLIVVDETSDKAQCKQAGVTRCRGVITWEMLRSLKAGAAMDLVAGEGVLMTLRRDPEVTISGGVSLSFLLDDGGEGNVVVGTNGSMYGSIKPLTGSVHYTLESCGRGCAVLMERPSDWFNQLQD